MLHLGVSIPGALLTNRFLGHLLALGLALALGGCAARPPPQPALSLDVAAWNAHQRTLRPIEAFTISARLSSGAIGTASLHWRQDGEHFSGRASGPFGAGAAALSGTPQSVTIRSGGETIETGQPELWMQTNFGWRLPVAGLRYWALGLPIPGVHASYAFDEKGRLAILEQSGWTLQYREYTEVDGIWLPRIVMLDDGVQEALLRVDQWQRVAGNAQIGG